MFSQEDLQRTCPPTITPDEWRLRVELAACYRVFDHKGWGEEIFNHITVRVPGPEKHYLINPFGLTYAEVTARNLVKVDLQGHPMQATAFGVNRAGFVIHSAVHAARDDAHCVMHTHNSFGLAVACKAGGLSMDNFYAAFLHDKLAYHDFEGVTVHEGEQERLVKNLGSKTCMILRSHGLLVAHHDIASAYYWMWALQRACEIQVLSGAIPGPNIALSQEACEVSSRDGAQTDPQNDLYNKVFAAAVRSTRLSIDDIA